MSDIEESADGRDIKSAAVTWFLVMLDALQAGDQRDIDCARRSLGKIGVHVVVDDSVYTLRAASTRSRPKRRSVKKGGGR